MSSLNDYHYRPAMAELEAAQRSTCPQAVQAHCALAELHLERSEQHWQDAANDTGHEAGTIVRIHAVQEETVRR